MSDDSDQINEITKLLHYADDELLDFVHQLLQKSVNPSAKEKYQQSA